MLSREQIGKKLLRSPAVVCPRSAPLAAHHTFCGFNARHNARYSSAQCHAVVISLLPAIVHSNAPFAELVSVESRSAECRE
jgi:hypothetical protein